MTSKFVLLRVWVLGLCWICFPAQALSLIEETDYSASQFDQSLTLDGDFLGHGDEDSPFDWALTYSYEQLVTPNGDQAAIVDDTSSFTGALGWTGESHFALGAKLNYALTPGESLVVRGGQLSFSYRDIYAGAGAQKFLPYLNFKLIASSTDYIETFNGSILRKKKAAEPVSGISELRQAMLGFDVTWRPRKAWKFDLEVDDYLYNRDVANFEAQLDSPTALQRGMSGFTSTVGGLASIAYAAGATWDFAPTWRAAVLEQYALLAADQSVSTTFRATVADQITDQWQVTVGVIRETSDVFNDTLAVLGVDFDFN